MATYTKYDFDDDTTIYIETMIEEGSMVPASPFGKNRIIEAKGKINDAFKVAKVQARIIIDEFDKLPVNEAKIKFGLKMDGDIGNFVVGSIGLGITYEVTFIWKRSDENK
jgi:hypothetical protein